MKYTLQLIAALALTGCTSGNDAAQQAEIERLKAETEKLREEAAKTNQDNVERQTEWEANKTLREAKARMNERAASGDLQGALAGGNNIPSGTINIDDALFSLNVVLGSMPNNAIHKERIVEFINKADTDRNNTLTYVEYAAACALIKSRIRIPENEQDGLCAAIKPQTSELR